MKDMREEIEDDGTLAFLNIPRDENNRSFNCDDVTQSKLVNTSFWIVDFITDVPTRFSKQKGTPGQTLVKIKRDVNSPESEARKFFTGSVEIRYVLEKVREMGKLPRKVTLRSSGNRFFLE